MNGFEIRRLNHLFKWLEILRNHIDDLRQIFFAYAASLQLVCSVHLLILMYTAIPCNPFNLIILINKKLVLNGSPKFLKILNSFFKFSI